VQRELIDFVTLQVDSVLVWLLAAPALNAILAVEKKNTYLPLLKKLSAQ
jgi:hypothetical protein